MIDYPDSRIANFFFVCTEVTIFYMKVISVLGSIVYVEWGMEGRRNVNDVPNCTVFLYHC